MHYATPHLTTSLTGPLQLLEEKFLEKEKDIEQWLQQQWELSPAPLYGSVDLRNAGFKLAPVDMNLFPAGFNNLNREFLPLAIDAAKQAITQQIKNAKQILFIPETHTRNVFYWENVRALLEVLQGAGFHVRLGWLADGAPQDITLSSGGTLKVEPIQRQEASIGLTDFQPDMILLNNDLSAGIPDILQGLAQPILPPAELGWSQRLKSEHFQYYADVTKEFSAVIDIDPWLMTPLFRHCGKIDFMQQDGLDCLISNVENLFVDIQKKYKQYDITYEPYIVVKADAGTYGMAVMIVKNIDDITNLNRKQRTAMSKSKGGQPVRSVIIQEGVYTFETWGEKNSVAEPVVYLWGERVVGGFYRVHQDKGVDENLNTPGMSFEPLAFVKNCHHPATDACANRFYAYGVVARLSMLAAAREMARFI